MPFGETVKRDGAGADNPRVGHAAAIDGLRPLCYGARRPESLSHTARRHRRLDGAIDWKTKGCYYNSTPASELP